MERHAELIAPASRGRGPVVGHVVAAFRGYADATRPHGPAGVARRPVEPTRRLPP